MTLTHMMQPRCALCGAELAPENDSAEHLITNAIGGKKKIKGVYCIPCNNSTGTLWDAEVARQFQFIALHLGIVRDRGTASSGTFATASGRPIHLHPDGSLSFPPVKPVVMKEGNAVRIASRVRTRAEAETMLRGFKRTYPKIDVDAAMQNIAEETSYLSEPVIGVTAFGGPKAGRSMVKSALTTGAELNLGVDFTFTNDELQFALSNADDATPAQVRAMNEVMAIAQQLSFKREEVRVARRAYRMTLSKLDLKPGQDMTPEIALAMSKEITAQMMPFLLHRLFTRGQ